jgi:hypothetical protein
MEMKKKGKRQSCQEHQCMSVKEWNGFHYLINKYQQFIEFGARPGKQPATAIPCPGLNRSRRIAGFSMG